MPRTATIAAPAPPAMTPIDIAFSPVVRATQARLGSRTMYEQVEARGGWPTTVTPELKGFLAEADSIYIATASAKGQPYIQHRGGPKGFLRVIDEKTLGLADFAGNRQYITVGNLAENPQAMIFVMDHVHRRRVKIWGMARVVEDDPAVVERLFPAGYGARPERAILFTVELWNRNCPQHIPQMFPAEEVGTAIDGLEARIRTLQAENDDLRARLGAPAPERVLAHAL